MRRSILAAFSLGLSFFLNPMPLPAAHPAAIDATATHTYLFAQQITFVLDATGEAALNRATVFFQSDRSALQQIDVDFEPNRAVHLEAPYELRGGAIPPFSQVSYWWELGDEAGQTLTTSRVTFSYSDNRFEWQRVSDGGVTVYWTEGNAAFGEAVLDTALEALPGIADEIGVAPPSTIEVYVYPSREDLIGALRLGGRDWAGGQARPDLGVVLIDQPSTDTATIELRRAIPHELTHLLVYAATQPNYDRVPPWLDEGLATANEVSPDPGQVVALASAVKADRLLSFEALCAPFPAEAGQALLAYAQSGDFMQFIRDRYGRQGMRGLLAAYRENAACAPGVERALNVTLSALESEWRAQFASGGETVTAVAEASAPWLVLLAIIGLALLPILGGLLARRS
ncbi:MAG TPA: peptidase MA family metallohydrolase [Anaerolineae bacterium]|nr:peptidase MA family metallohydrolase [Anaerolineae bacterium]